jgi:DNA-binding transcriptional LysR family regulator
MEDRDWLIMQALHAEKNITKTAQSLYMSQPALTSRLQHIEREFGVKLVHRSTKGIQFTSEGEYLVTSSSAIVDRFNLIKEEIKNLSQQNAGTLEIAASNYLTMYTLPHLLKRFKTEYPNAKFKVTTDWTKNIFSLIYNQKAHVGFVSVDYGGCKDMHLLYEEPICIASTTPFDFNDLPNLPRIEYKSDYLLKSQLDKWWRENFEQPPTISMMVDKLANCKEMVKFGLGYAILPLRILHDIPNIHRLDLKNKDNQPITRKTWMICNESSMELPLVNLFVDFVKKSHL